MLDLALYAMLFLCTLGGLALLVDVVLNAITPQRRAPRRQSGTARRSGARSGARSGPRKISARPSNRPSKPSRQVLIDGSNVVMWHKNAGLSDRPQIDTLLEVMQQIEAEGREPYVIFDATIGHWLQGRYLHEGDLRHLLGRPDLSLTVVQNGTTADAALLAEAARTGAAIVTNDRYRDHPKPHGLHLRTGHFDKGRIRLRATG